MAVVKVVEDVAFGRRSLAVPSGGPRAVRENPGGWLTTSPLGGGEL